jgi:putative ABC transport system permease protein
MNALRYTLRELRRRPARTLLTILGVAIGVAVLSATVVAIRGARLAYRELYEHVAGRDCLEVVAPGQAGFDPAAAGRFAAVPGVGAVVRRIVANAAVVATGGASPALVVATDSPDIRLSSRPDGALLDAAFARAHGCTVGQPLRLWTPAGLVELPLGGLFEPDGPTAFLGVALVRLPLATAQRLFGLAGQVNSVQLLLADGTDPGTVRAALAGRLSGGLMIQEPGQRGALARSTLFAAEQGLTCLGLVAAVAAAFIVLNTFLLNLAERRGEAAILRVLGATRAQVLALLLGESALLGLTGGGGGAFAGLGLALALRGAMQQFLGVDLPSCTPGAGHFLAAVLLGPALTLSATGIGALRYSRQDPLAALLRRGKQDGAGGPGWVPAAGLGLLVAAAVVEWLICQGRFPLPAGRALLAPGVALLLAGCVLAVPLLAAPVLWACGLVLGPVLGTEGRLALRQVTRQRTRLALTAGVLFVAVAAAVGMGHCLLNTLRDLRDWYRRTIVADFLVSGSAGDTSFLLSAPLPEALAGELGALPGVARVDLLAFAPVAAGGQPALALARTFAANLPLPLDLREGKPDAVRRGLLHGEVVVGAALARHLGLHAGDSIALATAGGPRPVRIAGTAVEYAAGGHALYVEWDTARGLLGLSGVHVFLVTSRPAAGRALRDYCRRHALLLQSNDELRNAIDGLLSRIVAALWALMAVIFVVAALGVTNTLALNVREQCRELGILRAVGATRPQIARFVLWQALLTGVVGLIPGAVLGVLLGALINGAAGAVTGQQAAFGVELPLTAGCLGLALALTAAAALLPACRAAGLAVVEALRG